MLISDVLFCLFCLIAGFATAAGFVAFISLIGVFERLQKGLHSAGYSRQIETAIILGVTAGNFIFVLDEPLDLGITALILLCFFGGVFVGCLAGALAETLKLFPIISRRMNIRKHLPLVLIACAFGKAFGNIIYSIIS